MTTGVVRHACRHRVTARGFFGFVGGVVAVCFEGGCGSMCWPVDRPATHAAAGAAARGCFWFGGFFCGWTGSRCGSQRLTTGVVRHACRLRRDGTRGFFVLGDSFAVGLGAVAGAGMRSRASRDAFPSGAWERHNALFGFVGGVVAVCFEGCCGSMCWPRERPATHAAAGAAARGVLIFLVWEILSHAQEWMARGGSGRMWSERLKSLIFFLTGGSGN